MSLLELWKRQSNKIVESNTEQRQRGREQGTRQCGVTSRVKPGWKVRDLFGFLFLFSRLWTFGLITQRRFCFAGNAGTNCTQNVRHCAWHAVHSPRSGDVSDGSVSRKREDNNKVMKCSLAYVKPSLRWRVREGKGLCLLGNREVFPEETDPWGVLILKVCTLCVFVR